MTKTFCDRCGKEMYTNPTTNATFPTYSIMRMDDLNKLAIVHLCIPCEKEFTKWLEAKNEH